MPEIPGDTASQAVVFQAAVTDHLYDAYSGAVCGIDDEGMFVTIAVGGPIGHAPTELALAKMLKPLPVGTVVELHGGTDVCPETADRPSP